MKTLRYGLIQDRQFQSCSILRFFIRGKREIHVFGFLWIFFCPVLLFLNCECRQEICETTFVCILWWSDILLKIAVSSFFGKKLLILRRLHNSFSFVILVIFVTTHPHSWLQCVDFLELSQNFEIFIKLIDDLESAWNGYFSYKLRSFALQIAFCHNCIWWLKEAVLLLWTGSSSFILVKQSTSWF